MPSPPPLEVVVSRLARLPSPVAADLARSDQRDRWAAGDPVLAERYLNALPHVAANPDDALVVVYGEVLLRSELGQAVEESTFAARFPQYRESLDLVFDIHRGLDAGTVSASPSPAIPDTTPVIAGYDRLRPAVRGGMGAVYQARSVESGRLVAVKVVRAAAEATAEELVRFLQEAVILAGLSHPNVVRYLANGVCNVGPYLVTEWIPGGSLDNRLPGAPVQHDWVLELVRGVADGLGAAHAVGVVHRDVKPGNILLDGSRRTESASVPKLTDFGLARLCGCGGTVTATGEVLGTRRYMPPEQLEGRAREIGPWSDLFSLGAVLYELLAHQPAFPERDTPAGLAGFTPPIPLRQFDPTVPPSLERACLRALKPDPAERYQTAAEFVAALTRST